MYLQYHVLTGYGPALLNADSTGEAKSIVFGGVPRTRVSSQSLKYAWRNAKDGLQAIDAKRSVRSRRTYRRLIADQITKEGYPRPLADGVTYALQSIVSSGSAPTATNRDLKSILKQDSDEDLLLTGQVVVLGEGEVDYLRSVAKEHLDSIVGELSDIDWSEPSKEEIKKAQSLVVGIGDLDLRKNLHSVGLGAGLSAALFGRMQTSNYLRSSSSSVQVSHAITVHRKEGTRDFFTSVDELIRDKGQDLSVIAHLGERDLSGGLFYMYVGIDVPQLVSNIEGVRKEDWRSVESELSERVLRHVPRMITTVSPGAKKGSTAPFSYARFMLAERTESQPRSLADAFLSPVPRDTERGVEQEAISRIGAHVAAMDRMYGKQCERMLSCLEVSDEVMRQLGVSEIASIDKIEAWSADSAGGVLTNGGPQ